MIIIVSIKVIVGLEKLGNFAMYLKLTPAICNIVETVICNIVGFEL